MSDNNRGIQSDEIFLGACAVPSSSTARRIALGARMIVAVHGGVDPLLIHAGDRYPEDLRLLPSWDSLGQVELLLEVEELTGRAVSDDAWAKLVDWDCFTVKELVGKLVELGVHDAVSCRQCGGAFADRSSRACPACGAAAGQL